MVKSLAATIVGLALLAGCTSTPEPAPAPAPSSAAAPQTVTLNIGAVGGEQVSFTDPTAPGGVRTETAGVMSSFSRKITVSKGSTVAVTLSGYGSSPVVRCSITDETDRLVYVEGKESCSYVAN